MNLEDIMLSEIIQTEKEKTAHDLTDMQKLKKSNIQKQRVEGWLSRVGRWEKVEILVKGYKDAVMQDE